MRKIGTPILHIVRLGHNVRSGSNVRSRSGVLPGFAVLLGLTILPGLTACGGRGHRVERTTEKGVPLVRTLGGPRHDNAPFDLVREVVFGDPARGPDGVLTQPRGYLEVPGGLAVFDEGDFTLKVYEADGTLRFRLGRQGQGPGEFESVWMNHGLAPDGRIVITDVVTARLTLVDPSDGAFEVLPLPMAMTWDVAGVGPDRFVMVHAVFTSQMEQRESLDLVDGSFTVLDTLAGVPPGRVVRVPVPGEGGHSSFVNVSRPFWPTFSWWAQGGRIAVCQGRDFRVELFDHEGRRQRILEWESPRTAVDDTMWAAVRRYIQRGYGEDWASVWEALERPDHVPPVEGVRLDDRGRVWALYYIPGERFGGPADPNLYWDVLDADGTWLGRQPTPGVARYFGRDVCYVTENREEGSVVVRYRLVPAFR